MKRQVKITYNGAIAAKEMTDSERALRLLAGWRPCPRCDGTRVHPYNSQLEITKGRIYHFKVACLVCSLMSVPGWFQPGDEMGVWEGLRSWPNRHR